MAFLYRTFSINVQIDSTQIMAVYIQLVCKMTIKIERAEFSKIKNERNIHGQIKWK